MADPEPPGATINEESEGTNGAGAQSARMLRVALPLILFAGLVAPLVFSTWLTFDRQRSSLERAALFELEQMAGILANGMREPIWNLAPELGQGVVESLARDPRVIRVEVTSEAQGRFLAAGSDAGDDAVAQLIARPVRRGAVEIGSVALAVDPTLTESHVEGLWTDIYLLGALQIVLSLAVVGFVYWGSRRLERERALRDMNRLLQREVRERSRELEAAHRELVRQDRLAVLGRLTATVSHELRNPLGTIRASFVTVDRFVDHDQPTAQRAIDRVERSIRRCVRIIDDLLNFARSGELSLEPTALDAWLREVVEEIEVPEGIVVRVDPRAGETAPVDRDRLRQAVVNVVLNACQAMTGADGAAAGQVSIATARADGRIELRIADTGPGIDPAEREQIFEPLYSTKPYGFGLGLPLVRQVMEQHGGGVELHAPGGPGAQFVLWLPVAEPPETARET